MANFGPSFVTPVTKTSDLIRTVRGHTQGGSRQGLNVLAQPVALGDDAVVLRYPLAGIQPGQTIEIDWTEYSIVDISTATKLLSVIPLIEGAGAAHAAGARVTFRPRYSVRRIIESINADLMSLCSAGLYWPVPVEADDVTHEITIPQGALLLLDAWSSDQRTKSLPASYYNISDSVSGPVLSGPATLAKATVGCVLGQLPLDTDVLVSPTTGLSEMAMDLPPLGAALRLLAGTESQRNIIDHQGDTRRADEVPTGGPTTALRNLAALRQQRLVEEVQRFQQRYEYSKYVGVF